jgi:thiol-disulfide isomerase/thioredoxin
LLVLSGYSQRNDQVEAPYLQDKKLPFFKVMLTDSSLFYKSDLKKNQPTVLIFFSPECEHCRKMTELLLNNIEAFKKTQIVMVSALPLANIKEFYTSLHIEKYKTIHMGKDDLYFFPTYFQAHYLPFIAVYNKKAELVKAWDGGTILDNIIEALHK